MPSISDQILDSAGMKLSGDSFLDEALADLKSKRRQTASDAEDLRDSIFSKVFNNYLYIEKLFLFLNKPP